MNNDSGCFLKGLASVFAVVLALLLPAVLLGFNLSFVLLDGEVYKQALAESNFYDDFSILIAEGTLAKEQFESPLYSAQYTEAVQYLAENVFETAWLQAQFEKLIDDIFAYVNGETEELMAVFSFAPMVDAMNGDRGIEVFRTYLEMLPECSAQELQEDISALKAGDYLLPYCQPPAAQLDALAEDIQSGFFENAEDPETLTPVMMESDDFDPESLASYRTFRQVLLYSPLLIFGLLGLIVLFAARSIGELLNWTSIPLAVGSLFALLTALIGYLYASDGLQRGIVEAMAEDASSRGAELFGGVVAEVAGIYMRTVLIEAGVLLALSAAAIALSLVVRRMQAGVE